MNRLGCPVTLFFRVSSQIIYLVFHNHPRILYTFLSYVAEIIRNNPQRALAMIDSGSFTKTSY